MAKGRRKKTADAGPRPIETDAESFRKAMAEAARHKESARTYSGYHGQHVKNFCETSGFSPKAFRIVQIFHGVADAFKRDDLIRAVLIGIELMGYAPQGDLFDGVRDRARALRESGGESAEPMANASPALPLDEAERAFGANAHKAPKPKASAALGEADASYSTR